MTIAFIVNYQWELFIGAELLSLLALVVFLLLRYASDKQGLSLWFLMLFILCTVFEAVLAWLVYREIGEMATFQIVVALFVVYACTFGIADFKKLDRYIKTKVGQWRGKNLLSEKDMRIIEQQKDPLFIARQNRTLWYVHVLLFLAIHYAFWLLFGQTDRPLHYFLTDLSWWANEDMTDAPFQSEAVMQISRIWIIVLAVDTIWSWSYTLFPEKKKQ